MSYIIYVQRKLYTQYRVSYFISDTYLEFSQLLKTGMYYRNMENDHYFKLTNLLKNLLLTHNRSDIPIRLSCFLFLLLFLSSLILSLKKKMVTILLYYVNIGKGHTLYGFPLQCLFDVPRYLICGVHVM